MNAEFDNKKRDQKSNVKSGVKSGVVKKSEHKSHGSKYSKKHNGQKKAVPHVKRDAPVFLYYVQGTDTLATKTPCEHKAEDLAERKNSQCPLGSWRNPVTGKPCKVDRVKNKTEDRDEASPQG